MKRLLFGITQLMPLVMMAMAVVTVAQFVVQEGAAVRHLAHWLWYAGEDFKAGTWFLAGAAVFCWFFAGVLVWHDRNRRNSTTLPVKRGKLMDILDRLTNRQELERRLATEARPMLIDAEALSKQLKEHVVGQDQVCTDVATQIRRRLALTHIEKPIGVFLFAGPPGTGKTFLAKRLAASLGRKLLYLDMTQFSQPFKSTQLFGSPKGYSGSDSYGKLTAGLRDVPDAVVLLDEIEKAHPEVHKNFLTAWNDGFVTEASDGAQISTTRAIFVMTSNAATDALQEFAIRYADDAETLRRASTATLKDAGFAPEVLNRIDRIFVFRPLAGLDIARVTALAIEDMIRSYGLEVAEGGIDPELLFDMLKRQSRLGNDASSRDLVRAAEETIADTLIDVKNQGHTRIVLSLREGAVIALPAQGPEP